MQYIMLQAQVGIAQYRRAASYRKLQHNSTVTVQNRKLEEFIQDSLIQYNVLYIIWFFISLEKSRV